MKKSLVKEKKHVIAVITKSVSEAPKKIKESKGGKYKKNEGKKRKK